MKYEYILLSKVSPANHSRKVAASVDRMKKPYFIRNWKLLEFYLTLKVKCSEPRQTNLGKTLFGYNLL